MNKTAGRTEPKRPSFPIELKPVLERALRGDRDAQQEIATAFERLPEFALELGDLARSARRNVITLLDGQNPTLREAYVRKADQLLTDLGRGDDTILERLLIERIAVAWLWVGLADMQLVERLRDRPGDGPACRDAAQRLNTLQKVFNSSVKTLALLRKLTTPRVSPLDLINAGSSEAAKPARRGVSREKRGELLVRN